MTKEDSISKGLKVVKVRLVRDNTLKRTRQVRNTDDAVDVMKEELSGYDREAFCVLNLRADGSVINMNVVSVGTLSASLTAPREVFKSSILANASSVILFHNHPSGNEMPSRTDYETTKRLWDAGNLLEIPVLDHIVVGGGNGRIHSFAANDELGKTYEQTHRDEMDWER